MRNQITAADRIKVKAATINSTNQEDWQPIEEQLLKKMYIFVNSEGHK